MVMALKNSDLILRILISFAERWRKLKKWLMVSWLKLWSKQFKTGNCSHASNKILFIFHSNTLLSHQVITPSRSPPLR